MAIQNRIGQDLWFDPNKMLPGEIAVSTDAKRVYMAFAPGDVREFAFKDQIPIVGDVTPDKLQEAVNNYLNENPVHAGATEEEAKQIELNRKNIVANDEAIKEVSLELKETNSNVSQLSNPNLFINGNFQIWSNGTEFLDVAASELTSVADRWSVFYNYDNPGMLDITKTEDGLCVAHGSVKPIIVTQVLDEETFNSLKGKTLTLSYGIINTEYTEYTRQIEVSNSDTDRFVFALENSYIELFDGDTLKWAKLEVGTVHTPCVSDSKDAIICKLEKRMVKTYSGENSIVGTGGWVTFTVTFPEPFTEIPFVSVMQTSLTSNENIALRGIDENGFTYEVYAPTTTFEYKSRWMAIGY